MDPFFPSFYPLGNKKEPIMKQYRATILLLEDDENLGFVTKDKLQEEGYFVKLCTDGEQAVKSIQTEHVDICLLDIMLPKMDGFTVGKIIKEKDVYTEDVSKLIFNKKVSIEFSTFLNSSS